MKRRENEKNQAVNQFWNGVKLKSIKEIRTKVAYFIKKEQKKVFLLFSVYFVPLFTIGLIGFPYVDDVDRQINGYTGFGTTYSRWGSEVASWIIQGGRHQVDLGIFMYGLSSLILTVSSLILVYCLNNRKLTWSSILVSSFLGLNPWFMECLLFRFDNPYMSLSILFSVLPFLFYERIKMFIPISVIAIFLMCNFYQSSSGIYIMIVIAFVFKSLVLNAKILVVFIKTLASAGSYILGLILFYLQLKLLPGAFVSDDNLFLASAAKIYSSINTNLDSYLDMYLSKSPTSWMLLIGMLFLSFIVVVLTLPNNNLLTKVFALMMYFLTGIPLSAGVFIVFDSPLLTVTPRYGYGLSVFCVITALLLLNLSRTRMMTFYSNKIALILFFYFFSFPFVTATSLDAQKTSFEHQSTLLATDLNSFVTPDRKIVQMNKLFRNAPLRLNNMKKYPLIDNLVPNNSALTWTNTLWFKSFSNLDIEIQPVDFNQINTQELEIQKQSSLYNIYTTEEEIFVEMTY
ncbi:hypothetical protein NRIC_18200 [Enterococcus florum]|uniref:Uncharacterized protein n=1 Tax=Enterococcus florum TaxID=2480627 RepID=A0A4V0WPI0_9ENTE|nr:glucosyltransferase domain-containing protein [Enterococcus florum]GCF93929.1 hypothetical protein NRIC_18200 [Enterococcus florum]